MIELNSLLVPVDFSETSKSAFAQALELATGENASIILLHVIDTAVSEMMAGAELGSQSRYSGPAPRTCAARDCGVC